MADQTIKISDFSGGLKSAGQSNLLDFPQNALADGQNVEIVDGGLRTRGGMSVASSGSLPYGDVVFLKQVRFPTNQVSYLLAQVNYYVGAEPMAASGQPFQDHSAVWDVGNGRVIVFQESSLFTFDPVANEWASLDVADGPGWRTNHSAIYDPTTERMIIFGGQDIDGVKLADTWALDCTLGAEAWTEITTTGTDPDPLMDHAAVYNSTAHTMVIIGGWRYFSGFGVDGIAQEVYSLDLTTNVWTQLGSWALGRYVAAAYDPTTDCIFMVGGIGPDGARNYLLRYSYETDTCTTETDLAPIPLTSVIQHRVVFCNDRLFVLGGMVGGEYNETPYSYGIATDEWTEVEITGLPADWIYHAMVVTDQAEVIVMGYQDNAADTWLLPSVCGSIGRGSGLYACPDHFPTTTAAFTRIYDLGEGAGTVTADVLNDRCVVTEGINEPPLVFPGCMTADGSDWAYPKAVLASQDGVHFYDVSAYVLDNDPDTVADIGGIRTWGYLAICCDMPQVEGFCFDMNTPNAGLSGDQNQFTDLIEFTSDNKVARQDLSGGIEWWQQDGGATGHFEGEAAEFNQTAAVDKGGGKVGFPADNHGFTSGDPINVHGTTNYDAFYAVDATTTTNEIVVTATYTPETFTSTACARKRLSLGTGNDCPDMMEGVEIIFGDATTGQVKTITGDGKDSGEVELVTAKAETAVSAVYGIAVVNNRLSPYWNATPDNTSVDYGDLTARTWHMVGKKSVRVIVPADEITGSGDRIRITLEASDLGTADENKGFVVDHCAIVERDGTTINGTETPTEITFDNGLHGCTVAKGLTKLSDIIDFTIDESKTYLLILDIHAPDYRPGYLTSRMLIPTNDWLGGSTASSTTGVYMVDHPTYDQETVATGAIGPYMEFVGGLKKLETFQSKIPPQSLVVAHTNDTSQVDISFINSMKSVTADESKPTGSSIFHAVSFDGRTTFRIFNGTSWPAIVRNNSGTWQYLDTGWVNASENTLLQALRQAMGVTANQFGADALNAVTSEQWSATDGVIPGITQSLDFAVGMLAVGEAVPEIRKYTVVYQDEGSGIFRTGEFRELFTK